MPRTRARAAGQLRREPAHTAGGGTDGDRLAGLHGDGADRGERRHTDRPQGARADPVQRACLGRQVLPVGYDVVGLR